MVAAAGDRSHGGLRRQALMRTISCSELPGSCVIPSEEEVSFLNLA